VNPVGVYVPLADVYSKFGIGALNMDVEIEKQLGTELVLELRRSGYDFDFLNDDSLARVASVEAGTLRAGTGAYSVVIVPDVQYMPPESLDCLLRFVREGGFLIFAGRLPSASPGLADSDARTAAWIPCSKRCGEAESRKLMWRRAAVRQGAALRQPLERAGAPALRAQTRPRNPGGWRFERLGAPRGSGERRLPPQKGGGLGCLFPQQYLFAVAGAEIAVRRRPSDSSDAGIRKAAKSIKAPSLSIPCRPARVPANRSSSSARAL